MSPLAVLTGIIMGSAITIAVGLAMVLVVFLLLAGEQPRLASEYGDLLASFAQFFVLAVLASWAFLGALRGARWIWLAQAATWLAIAAIGIHYWPR